MTRSVLLTSERRRTCRQRGLGRFAPLACDVLIARVAGLKDHVPPVDLGSHGETRRLMDESSPPISRAYKKREDLLDAVICAWTAALWHRYGTACCQVLGVPEDGSPVGNGTIIAPCREAQRTRATEG